MRLACARRRRAGATTSAEGFDVARAHQHAPLFDQEFGHVLGQAASAAHVGALDGLARAAGQAHGADRAEQALEVVFGHPSAGHSARAGKWCWRTRHRHRCAHRKTRARGSASDQRQVAQLDVDGDVPHAHRPRPLRACRRRATRMRRRGGRYRSQAVLPAWRMQRRARPGLVGQQVVDRRHGRRSRRVAATKVKRKGSLPSRCR
jgi:hypothetical protein